MQSTSNNNNRSRPVKPRVLDVANNSAHTNPKIRNTSKTRHKAPQRNFTKMRASSAGRLEGKPGRRVALPPPKARAQYSMSSSSYVGTSTSSRSSISSSALVDIPRFSSESLLKHPCKWEAVEIRYMERDKCVTLKSTSGSEDVGDATPTSKASPRAVSTGTSVSPKDSAGTSVDKDRQQRIHGEESDVKKQTVVVEKLHVRNLLNTIREQCGDLSTSRLSEYRPALQHMASPRSRQPSRQHPIHPGDEADCSLLDSLTEGISQGGQQPCHTDAIDHAHRRGHSKIKKGMERENKRGHRASVGKNRCDYFQSDPVFYRDMHGKVPTSSRSSSPQNNAHTRDQATQLDSDVGLGGDTSGLSQLTGSSGMADTIVICPKNQPASRNMTPILQEPAYASSRRQRHHHAEFDTRGASSRSPTDSKEREVSEVYDSRSSSSKQTSPVLSQQEIDCYKQIALRVLLDRKKLEQNQRKTRSESGSQKPKTATAVASDRQKMTAPGKKARTTNKPYGVPRFSNNGVCRFRNGTRIHKFVEVVPTEQRVDGSVLSATRIRGQIEKHKRRMSESPKARAVGSAMPSTKKSKRRGQSSSRGRGNQSYNTSKNLSGSSQESLGSARVSKFGTGKAAHRGTERQRHFCTQPMQSTVRTMSPLSRTLYNAMMKQEQEQEDSCIKAKKTTVISKKPRRDDNVLIYEEFHKMLVEAAKSLARSKTPIKEELSGSASRVPSEAASGDYPSPCFAISVESTSAKPDKPSSTFKAKPNLPTPPKLKESRGKTGSWVGSPRVTSTPNSPNFSQKPTPSLMCDADVEHQVRTQSFGYEQKLQPQCDEQEGKQQYNNRRVPQQQRQQQLQPGQQQQRERLLREQRQLKPLQPLQKQHQQKSSPVDHVLAKDHIEKGATSNLNKSSGEKNNIGFTEMLKSILRSPTARAAQALGSHQTEPTAPEEPRDTSEMTVDQIIQCYQEIFSEMNSHVAHEGSKSFQQPTPQLDTTKDERSSISRAMPSTNKPPAPLFTAKAPIPRAMSSTNQTSNPPSTANASIARVMSSTNQLPASFSQTKSTVSRKSLHASFLGSIHRPCNVEEKRHQRRSASMTADGQEKLPSFRRQTQSSLNKINMLSPGSSRPSSPTTSFVKARSKNLGVEKQGDVDKSIIAVSDKDDQVVNRHIKQVSNCTNVSFDGSKNDSESTDISAIVCNSHPVLNKQTVGNGYDDLKAPRRLVSLNSPTESSRINIKPHPEILLNEDNCSESKFGDVKTLETKLDPFKRDQNSSKFDHILSNLRNRNAITDHGKLRQTLSDSTVPTPGCAIEDKKDQVDSASNKPRDLLTESHGASALSKDILGIKTKALDSTSQQANVDHTQDLTLSDLYKSTSSKNLRDLSEAALESASTRKPPVPISRKIQGSECPRPKNSIENLLERKVPGGPNHTGSILQRIDLKSYATPEDSESMTSQALRQKRSGNQITQRRWEHFINQENPRIQQDDVTKACLPQPGEFREQITQFEKGSFYAEISNEPPKAETRPPQLKSDLSLSLSPKIAVGPSLSDSGLLARPKELHKTWQYLAKDVQEINSVRSVRLQQKQRQGSCGFGENSSLAGKKLCLLSDSFNLEFDPEQSSSPKDAKRRQPFFHERFHTNYLKVDDDDGAQQVSAIRSCGAVTRMASYSKVSENEEDSSSLALRQKPPVYATGKALPPSLSKPRQRRMKEQRSCTESDSTEEESSPDSTANSDGKCKSDSQPSRDSDAACSFHGRTSPSAFDDNVGRELQDRTVAKTCEMVLNQPPICETSASDPTDNKWHSLSLGDFSEGSSHSSKQDELTAMTRASPSSSQHSSWVLSYSWEDELKRKERYSNVISSRKNPISSAVKANPTSQQRMPPWGKCSGASFEAYKVGDEEPTRCNRGLDYKSELNSPRQLTALPKGREKARTYNIQNSYPEYVNQDVNGITEPHSVSNGERSHISIPPLHEEDYSENTLLRRSATDIVGMSRTQGKLLANTPSSTETSHIQTSRDGSLSRCLDLKEPDTNISWGASSTKDIPSGDTESSFRRESIFKHPLTCELSDFEEACKDYPHGQSDVADLKARPLASLEELRLSRVGRSIFAERRKICQVTSSSTIAKALSLSGYPAHVLDDSQETCSNQTEVTNTHLTHDLGYTSTGTADSHAVSATYTTPSACLPGAQSSDNLDLNTQSSTSVSHPQDHYPRKIRGQLQCSNLPNTYHRSNTDSETRSAVHDFRQESLSRDFTNASRGTHVAGLSSLVPRSEEKQSPEDSSGEKAVNAVSSENQQHESSPPPLGATNVASDKNTQSLTSRRKVPVSDPEKNDAIASVKRQTAQTDPSLKPLSAPSATISCCESVVHPANTFVRETEGEKESCSTQTQFNLICTGDHQGGLKAESSTANIEQVAAVSRTAAAYTSTTELNIVSNTGDLKLFKPSAFRPVSSSRRESEVPNKQEVAQKNDAIPHHRNSGSLPHSSEKCSRIPSLDNNKIENETRAAVFRSDNVSQMKRQTKISLGGSINEEQRTKTSASAGCDRSLNKPLSRAKSVAAEYIERKVWENLELFLQSVKEDFVSVKEKTTHHQADPDIYSFSAPPHSVSFANTAQVYIPDFDTGWSKEISDNIWKMSPVSLPDKPHIKLERPKCPLSKRVATSKENHPRLSSQSSTCGQSPISRQQTYIPCPGIGHSSQTGIPLRSPMFPGTLAATQPANETIQMVNIFSDKSPNKTSRISCILSAQPSADLSQPVTSTWQSPQDISCLRTGLSPILSSRSPSIFPPKTAQHQHALPEGYPLSPCRCHLNSPPQKPLTLLQTRPPLQNKSPDEISACPQALPQRGMNSPVLTKDTQENADTPWKHPQHGISPALPSAQFIPGSVSQQRASVVLTEEDIHFLLNVSNKNKPIDKDTVNGLLSLDAGDFSKCPIPNEGDNLMLFSEATIASPESLTDNNICLKDDSCESNKDHFSPVKLRPAQNDGLSSSSAESLMLLISPNISKHPKNSERPDYKVYKKRHTDCKNPLHHCKMPSNATGSESSTLSQENSNCISYSRYINADECIFCSKFCSPQSKDRVYCEYSTIPHSPLHENYVDVLTTQPMDKKMPENEASKQSASNIAVKSLSEKLLQNLLQRTIEHHEQRDKILSEAKKSTNVWDTLNLVTSKIFELVDNYRLSKNRNSYRNLKPRKRRVVCNRKGCVRARKGFRNRVDTFSKPVPLRKSVARRDKCHVDNQDRSCVPNKAGVDSTTHPQPTESMKKQIDAFCQCASTSLQYQESSSTGKVHSAVEEDDKKLNQTHNRRNATADKSSISQGPKLSTDQRGKQKRKRRESKPCRNVSTSFASKLVQKICSDSLACAVDMIKEEPDVTATTHKPSGRKLDALKKQTRVTRVLGKCDNVANKRKRVTGNHDVSPHAMKHEASASEFARSAFSGGMKSLENNSLNAKQTQESERGNIFDIPYMTKDDSSFSLETPSSLFTKRTSENSRKTNNLVTACFSSRVSFLKTASLASENTDDLSDSSFYYTDCSCKSFSLETGNHTRRGTFQKVSSSAKDEIQPGDKTDLKQGDTQHQQYFRALDFLFIADKSQSEKQTKAQEDSCLESCSPGNCAIAYARPTSISEYLQPRIDSSLFLAGQPRLLTQLVHEFIRPGLCRDIQLKTAVKDKLCIVLDDGNQSELEVEKIHLKPEKLSPPPTPERFAGTKNCKCPSPSPKTKGFVAAEEVKEIPQVKTKGYRVLEHLNDQNDEVPLGEVYTSGEYNDKLYGLREEDTDILGDGINIILVSPADEGRIFLGDLFTVQNNGSSSCNSRDVDVDLYETVEPTPFIDLPERPLNQGFATFCYPNNVVIFDENCASENGQFIHPYGNILFCAGRDTEDRVLEANEKLIMTEEISIPDREAVNEGKCRDSDQQNVPNAGGYKQKCQEPGSQHFKQHYRHLPHKTRRNYCSAPCHSKFSTTPDAKIDSHKHKIRSSHCHCRTANRIAPEQFVRTKPLTRGSAGREEPKESIRASASCDSCCLLNSFRQRRCHGQAESRPSSTSDILSELEDGWWHLPTSPAAKPRRHHAGPLNSNDDLDVDTYDDLGSFMTEMQDTTTSTRTWDGHFERVSPWKGGLGHSCSLSLTRTSTDMMSEENMVHWSRTPSSSSSSSSSSSCVIPQPIVQPNTYVDNSTQIHNTLRAELTPVRCQGEQTDLVEQRWDKSTQAETDPDMCKRFPAASCERCGSPHLTVVGSPLCPATFFGQAAPSADTIACSALQDFIRLSFTTFVENVVESKLKKETHSASFQTDETVAKRCEAKEKNEANCKISESVVKPSPVAGTDPNETVRYRNLQGAPTAADSNGVQVVENNITHKAKRSMSTQDLRVGTFLKITPSTLTPPFDKAQRNCSGKKFGLMPSNISLVENEAKTIKKTEAIDMIKNTACPPNTQTVEMPTAPDVADSFNSKQTYQACKETKLDYDPINTDCNDKKGEEPCQSYELNQPSIDLIENSHLGKSHTHKSINFPVYKPTPFTSTKKSGHVEHCEAAGVPNVDLVVCINGKPHTVGPATIDSDKCEQPDNGAKVSSDQALDQHSKGKEETKRTPSLCKPHVVNRGSSDDISSHKDSVYEVTTISSSSSSQVDYGGLKYVLSRESKALWKQLTFLERSYESCDLCKKQYKRTTGRSLSPHRVRPIRTYPNRACRLHKSSKAFKKNHNVQRSKSSTGLEMGRRRTNFKSSFKSIPFKEKSKCTGGNNAREQLLTQMDNYKLRSRSETGGVFRNKQCAAHLVSPNLTTKQESKLGDPSASLKNRRPLLTTSPENTSCGSRPPLKRRLKLPAADNEIPPCKKASQSSCRSTSHADIDLRPIRQETCHSSAPHSRSKVIGGAYRRPGGLRGGKTARMVRLFEKSSCSSVRTPSTRSSTTHSGASGRSNNASSDNVLSSSSSERRDVPRESEFVSVNCFITQPKTKTGRSTPNAVGALEKDDRPLDREVKCDSICDGSMVQVVSPISKDTTMLSQKRAQKANLQPAFSRATQKVHTKKLLPKLDAAIEKTNANRCRALQSSGVGREAVAEFPLRTQTSGGRAKGAFTLWSNTTQPEGQVLESPSPQRPQKEDGAPQIHSVSPDADQCIKTLGNILYEMRNTFPEDRTLAQARLTQNHTPIEPVPVAGSELAKQIRRNISPKHSEACNESNSASPGSVMWEEIRAKRFLRRIHGAVDIDNGSTKQKLSEVPGFQSERKLLRSHLFPADPNDKSEDSKNTPGVSPPSMNKKITNATQSGHRSSARIKSFKNNLQLKKNTDSGAIAMKYLEQSTSSTLPHDIDRTKDKISNISKMVDSIGKPLTMFTGSRSSICPNKKSIDPNSFCYKDDLARKDQRDHSRGCEDSVNRPWPFNAKPVSNDFAILASEEVNLGERRENPTSETGIVRAELFQSEDCGTVIWGRKLKRNTTDKVDADSPATNIEVVIDARENLQGNSKSSSVRKGSNSILPDSFPRGAECEGHFKIQGNCFAIDQRQHCMLSERKRGKEWRHLEDSSRLSLLGPQQSKFQQYDTYRGESNIHSFQNTPRVFHKDEIASIESVEQYKEMATLQYANTIKTSKGENKPSFEHLSSHSCVTQKGIDLTPENSSKCKDVSQTKADVTNGDLICRGAGQICKPYHAVGSLDSDRRDLNTKISAPEAKPPPAPSQAATHLLPTIQESSAPSAPTEDGKHKGIKWTKINRNLASMLRSSKPGMVGGRADPTNTETEKLSTTITNTRSGTFSTPDQGGSAKVGAETTEPHAITPDTLCRDANINQPIQPVANVTNTPDRAKRKFDLKSILSFRKRNSSRERRKP